MERDLNTEGIDLLRVTQEKKRRKGLKGPWVLDAPGTVSMPAEVWIRLQENPDEADDYDAWLEDLMSEAPTRSSK